MNIFSIITLLSSLTCLLIAEVVYHSDKKENSNRVFALSSLWGAYFLFYYFMCQQAESINTAYLWNKIGSLWYFILVFFLHFTLIFTEKVRLLKNKITYILLYAPALLFSILSLTTNLLSGQLVKYEYGGYSAYETPKNPTWIYYAMIIWILLIISLGIAFYIHYYIKTTDRIKKIKVRTILYSFFIPFLLTFIEEFFILMKMKIRIPEIDVISIVWLNVCTGYGIWKYDLFKIDPVRAAENIIATMPDSLILIDLDFKIVGINPPFVLLFGYQETEIKGQSADILFKNKESTKTILKNFLSGKKISDLETELKTKSGQTIPALFSGSVIKHKSGKNIGFVCIVHDITRRKESEKTLLSLNRQLDRSNQELQDFAYIASHDLQEPLRKINTFGERLKEKYYSLLNTQGQDYLERMMNASNRMRTLINDLLSYSRVTTHVEPYSSVDLIK